MACDVYQPEQKSAHVMNGVGTLRLPPSTGGEWLFSVSSSGDASLGVPVLVLPDVWDRIQKRQLMRRQGDFGQSPLAADECELVVAFSFNSAISHRAILSSLIPTRLRLRIASCVPGFIRSRLWNTSPMPMSCSIMCIAAHTRMSLTFAGDLSSSSTNIGLVWRQP